MTRGTSAAALAVAALAVRYAAWAALDGPVTAVDSVTYRAFGQAIARGDFSGFARLPFYALYPLTLAPMYALSLPEPVYLKWLHLLASTSTVLLMARIAARLAGERAGLLTGVVAAVYPFFLFWLPYVLTETLFLLCLAAYVYACVLVIERPGAAAGWTYAAALVAFSLSRPSAVICIGFSWLVLGAWLVARRSDVRRGLVVTAGTALACAAAAALTLASSPSVRNRVLSIPTIGQTLWTSTKYSTGTLEELRALEALDQEMHTRFEGPSRERDEYAYKVGEAFGFIRAHPLAYLGMAARRLAAFWFPWLFAASWSIAHRALDAVASVGLTALVLLALTRRTLAPWPLSLLAAMWAAFALLSAFGQLDPDARYRLPAELLALIAGAGGLQLADPRRSSS